MILDLYSLIQKVTGSSLVLWGFALLVNPNIIQALYKTFTNKEDNEALIYLTAGMFLTFGLIIVWIHNDWFFSPALIITLIGWILIVKTMFWIVLPSVMIRITKKLSPFILNKWFILSYGVFLVILGTVILFIGNL
ncbi:MAG: hypothetical protein GDA46_04775 [Bdellovibrionales bacterium]|nr:hypothetical protein [Bdellovibrionales bacterium]